MIELVSGPPAVPGMIQNGSVTADDDDLDPAASIGFRLAVSDLIQIDVLDVLDEEA
jgi:hypothetical protein